MIKVNHLREILCFALVGVAATAVHYLVALIAVEALHMSVYVANLSGYICAVAVSYFGHGKLTFRAHLDYSVFRRFVLVSLITFCASELFLLGLEMFLHLSHRLALAFVVLFVPAVSFVLNKFWVYRHPDKRTISSAK